MNLKRVTELVSTIGELEASLTRARGELIREVNGRRDPPPTEPTAHASCVERAPVIVEVRKVGRPRAIDGNKSAAVRSMAARGEIKASDVVGVIGGSMMGAAQLLSRLRRSGDLKRVSVGTYAAAV